MATINLYLDTTSCVKLAVYTFRERNGKFWKMVMHCVLELWAGEGVVWLEKCSQFYFIIIVWTLCMNTFALSLNVIHMFFTLWCQIISVPVLGEIVEVGGSNQACSTVCACLLCVCVCVCARVHCIKHIFSREYMVLVTMEENIYCLPY